MFGLKRTKVTLINDVNDSVVINLLARNRLSRCDIARKTGISRPTVSRIVNRLMARRLVEPVGKGEVGPLGGKKPELLEISRRGGYLIGLDIGSFETKAVITDLLWQEIGCKVVRTECETTDENAVANIGDLVSELIVESGIVRTDVRGLGVGCSAVVDEAQGRVVYAASIPALRDIPLKELLEKKLEMPVHVTNSMNIQMIGENYLDEELNGRNFMCVYVGGGIGLNVLLNNRVILSSYNKNVWDFAHITAEMDGPLCHCGMKGCLEAVAGGWAICREGKKRVEEDASCGLSRIVGGDPEGVTGEAVIKAAESGDEGSLQIVQRAGECLGSNLSKFIQFFAPERVVFTGGLLREKNVLMRCVVEAVRREMPREQFDRIGLRVSKLNKFSAALGATRLVAHEVFKTPLLELLSIGPGGSESFPQGEGEEAGSLSSGGWDRVLHA